jgi:hypothetical protein
MGLRCGWSWSRYALVCRRATTAKDRGAPPPIARSLPYQCFPTIITQCATRHDLATKLPSHTYAYHAALFMAYDTLCVLNVRCFAIKATNQRLLGPTWNTRAPPGWRPSETIPWGTVYSCQGRRCLPGRSRCLRCPRHKKPIFPQPFTILSPSQTLSCALGYPVLLGLGSLWNETYGYGKHRIPLSTCRGAAACWSVPQKEVGTYRHRTWHIPCGPAADVARAGGVCVSMDTGKVWADDTALE